MTKNFVALAAIALCATASQAAQIAVSSYDMNNGDGQAHGGTYNYWDANYGGAGATTTDGLSGSTLSGGTGKLTDGVIASTNWYDASNNAGTGQYVGWLTPDSTSITFHFGSIVDIDEIKLYVDNSNVGGVSAPGAVHIGSQTFANSLAATPSLPAVLDFTGLGLHGDSVTLSMDYANGWVFLSEAQFFTSASAVPEADNVAMLLGGLSLFAFLARRRRG